MRRFRFSLLTLLVVLTITAVAIVWGQQYMELHRLRASHRERLKANLRAQEAKLTMYEGLVSRTQTLNDHARGILQKRQQAAADEIGKLKEELSELGY